MMKARIIFLASIFLIALSWNSCKKDKTQKPAISFTELGYNNTGVGYIGGSLHMAASIQAEKKIDNIQVGVHPVSGMMKSGLGTGNANEAWEVDTIYTDKYAGATVTEFDE
jgi:hypothetical protein